MSQKNQLPHLKSGGDQTMIWMTGASRMNCQEEKAAENWRFLPGSGWKKGEISGESAGTEKHVSRQLDFDVEVNMDDICIDRKLDKMEERERRVRGDC